MTRQSARVRSALLASVAAASVSVVATSAMAGGFDVREQSTYFQGMSFAGSAAGGDLSSMYWNPAALGEVGAGFTTSSSYSLLLPRADLTATSADAFIFPPGVIVTVPAAATGADYKEDVAQEAVVPASYAAYRLTDNLVLGLGINSQFGLGTSPGNEDWLGSVWGRSSKLFSVNATPTVSYQISDAITVAAGVQLQYMDLKRFRSGQIGAPSSTLEGDDFGVGYTLGVQFKPAAGTSIGVGFRSSISHELEGSVTQGGAPAGILSAPVHADIDLPEKVTASFRQDLASNFRLLGTVEWTNWSRLGVIPVILDGNFVVPAGISPVLPFGGVIPKGGTVANLDFQWEDGWFYSGGVEYDMNSQLTLRAGLAYEESPIRKPTQRLVQLPDSDRIWASFGGSYKVGNLLSFISADADTTVHFGYTHIFVEDAEFDRVPSSVLAPPLHLKGEVEASVDIISIGMTTKW